MTPPNPPDVAPSYSGAAPAPGRRSIAYAWLTGIALVYPCAWVLSWLAQLQGLLGLFFYAFAGLLVGAAAYRAGSVAAPVSKRQVRLLALGLAVLVWAAELYVEYRRLPRTVAVAVRGTIGRSLRAEELQHLRDEIDRHVSAHLDRYGPGGFAGYLVWAATDGAAEVPRVVENSTSRFSLRQRPPVWLARVGLSWLVLWAAIRSQLIGLLGNRQPPPEEEETHHRPDP